MTLLFVIIIMARFGLQQINQLVLSNQRYKRTIYRSYLSTQLLTSSYPTNPGTNWPNWTNKKKIQLLLYFQISNGYKNFCFYIKKNLYSIIFFFWLLLIIPFNIRTHTHTRTHTFIINGWSNWIVFDKSFGCYWLVVVVVGLWQ